MDEPLFIETFNVTNSTADKYRGCIKRLRKSSWSFVTPSLRLPVLPPRPNDSPTQFFDVVLGVESGSVRLRIQTDNLYLVGYRDNDATQWYEFGTRNEERVIPESKLLGFDGSYGTMEARAKQEREYISLGHLQLDTAIRDLLDSAESNNTARKMIVRARSLIIIIQMICEGMRFAFISNEIATNYTGEGYRPTHQAVNLETNWEKLSKEVLRQEKNPGPMQLLVPNPMEINTIADLAHMMGIVLYQHIPDGGESSTRELSSARRRSSWSKSLSKVFPCASRT